MSKNKMPSLSASRLKNFIECSWLFFQTYMEKVPEKVHVKTRIGSVCHSILESLCNPRHKATLDLITKNRDIYSSPSIDRLVRIYCQRNRDFTAEHLLDIDKLVFVALDHDFHCANAIKVLPPEHEFLIDFGDFSIKGFMDRVIIHENVAIIRDYKTQGKRFTEDQLEMNLQAFFYQSAIKHEFGLPATVEFIMLRFPANKKDPQRYIQRIPPFTEPQLTGFRYYLGYLNKEVNGLTVETAKGNFKANKDRGFCDRVCSLKNPFDYQCVSKDGKPIRGAFVGEEVKLNEGETLEVKRYKGCAFFYSQ